MKLTRRFFLFGFLGLLGTLTLVVGGVTWSKRKILALVFGKHVVPEAPLAVADGADVSFDREILWRLFEAVRQKWDLPSAVSRDELNAYLDLRVGGTPSYSRVYRVAAQQFSNARGESEDDVDALHRLLATPRDPDNGVFPDAAHTYNFVVRELINLQLSRGGAGTFGPTNVRGYFGGELAYRKAKT